MLNGYLNESNLDCATPPV